jgi:hypothetical protein
MTTTKVTYSKKSKKKKIRFRKLVLKISSEQMHKLDLFCNYHNTTSIRLVKKAINEYLDNHAADIPVEEPVVKNQLKLFDPEEYNKKGEQIELFE